MMRPLEAAAALARHHARVDLDGQASAHARAGDGGFFALERVVLVLEEEGKADGGEGAEEKDEARAVLAVGENSAGVKVRTGGRKRGKRGEKVSKNEGKQHKNGIKVTQKPILNMVKEGKGHISMPPWPLSRHKGTTLIIKSIRAYFT